MDLKLEQIHTLPVNITSSLDLSDDEQFFTIVTRRMATNSSMYEYWVELYGLP